MLNTKVIGIDESMTLTQSLPFSLWLVQVPVMVKPDSDPTISPVSVINSASGAAPCWVQLTAAPLFWQSKL